MGSPGGNQLPDLGRRLLHDESALSPSEARALFGQLLDGGWTYERYIATATLLIEAELGEPATAALVETIVELPAERFVAHDVNLWMAIARLGLMLLRVSASAHASLTSALEARFQSLTATPPPPPGDGALPIYALDFVLHGLDGARRAFPRGIGLGQLPFLDIPQAVAANAIEASAAAGPFATPPDVRRIFLAGAEALDVESRWIAGYTKVVSTAPQIMLDTYGLVNDARTVSLVLTLGARRPLAKAATAWLAEHAQLARPALERLAVDDTDPSRAAAAKEALAKLS